MRRQRRIERALRASHLPLDKTLETFERTRLPRKIDTLVNALIEGSFLDRCENVLAFGPPGSGKTHLLCAIGLELIYAGRRVLLRRCDVLVQELLAAKRDLVLPRVLKQWGRFDALLIDDHGYVQHSRQEMEVLFNLLAHRYERGSVLITSNLPFSRWEEIFKDPMTTAAAIDRLVHHSVIPNSTSPATGWRRRKRSVVPPDGAKSSWLSQPQANGRDDAVPGRNTDVDNLPVREVSCSPCAYPLRPCSLQVTKEVQLQPRTGILIVVRGNF